MTEKNNQSMDMDVEVTVPEEEDYLTLEFDDGEMIEIGRASCRERV